MFVSLSLKPRFLTKLTVGLGNRDTPMALHKIGRRHHLVAFNTCRANKESIVVVVHDEKTHVGKLWTGTVEP